MPNGRVRARVERGSSIRRHRFPRSNGFSFEDGFLEIDLDVDLDEPGCFFAVPAKAVSREGGAMNARARRCD